MQEDNNFETIISTWRRLSGEQIETAGVSMAGDTPDSKPLKKKEETDLLIHERTKMPVAAVPAAEPVAVSSDMLTDSTEKSEEKQEFIKRDIIEPKEAAGDTYEKASKGDKYDDYLEDDKDKNKSDKNPSEKHGDKVDSVYLRPPPAHKTRSNASTVEQDDCGINCLYYTLQCCECIVM